MMNEHEENLKKIRMAKRRINNELSITDIFRVENAIYSYLTKLPTFTTKEAFDFFKETTQQQQQDLLISRGIEFSEIEGIYYDDGSVEWLVNQVNPFTEKPIKIYWHKNRNIELNYKLFVYKKMNDDNKYVKGILRKKVDILGPDDLFEIRGPIYQDPQKRYFKEGPNNKDFPLYSAREFDVQQKKKAEQEIEKRRKNVKERDKILKEALENHKIDGKDFLTRTAVTSCIYDNHEVEDIHGAVEIMLKDGTRKYVLFQGAFCKTCKKYYILDSEFKRLKKLGLILCKVVTKSFWINTYGTRYESLNIESKLHMYGYNVNAKNNLSIENRRAILRYLIDERIMTKYEICNFIESLINMNKGRINYQNAVDKWESDLSYIKLYNIGKLDVVKVKSIQKNTYNPKI